jgi:hypothetical protein
LTSEPGIEVDDHVVYPKSRERPLGLSGRRDRSKNHFTVKAADPTLVYWSVSR